MQAEATPADARQDCIALFLKSAAPAPAIPKYHKGNDKGNNDQANGSKPPAHAHTPIQTATPTKQHQQYNQDNEQIHAFPLSLPLSIAKL